MTNNPAPTPTVLMLEARLATYDNYGSPVEFNGYDMEALRELLRNAAAMEPRWIPWKPGDALPATAPLHWTTWFYKEYTDTPMMRANYAHDFERWNVIAYWSAPLPSPYDAALAAQVQP